MRLLVIGLGSMGKRRIRLIKSMYPSFEVFGIDVREDRRKECEDMFRIKVFPDIEVAMDLTINCAFVCTSPLSHAAIIKKCLNNHWHVFTELNLVTDGYEEIIRLVEKNGCVLFLSSTFLHREEICYIQSKVTNDRRWNYMYHTGQYLPDWHPWENYRGYFLGDKRTNGCREILAIELPWLTATFGDVVGISVLSDKMTGLQIDYKDNYLIQFSHENGNKGCFIADVVSPVATRNLEIYSEDRYISWKGTPDSLKEYDESTKRFNRVFLKEVEEHMEGYSEFIVENAYRNEIKDFFEAVFHGYTPRYSFRQDMKVLEIIDKIGA